MSDLALRRRVQDRLLAEAPEVLRSPSRWERRVRVREVVARLLADEHIVAAPDELASIVRDLADEIVGLGPLEPYLRDPSVTEIMVNGPTRTYIERDGRLTSTDLVFPDDQAVVHLIDRIVAPLGLRIDASRPWVDARLPDGSRVHAIIPPLSIGGPVVTIRKFSREPLRLQDLVRAGSATESQASALVDAVNARRTIIISGGAGSGKTTLLRALAMHIPSAERVITIEDAAELRLRREHVIPLETRPDNVEGRGAVGVQMLVRNALRMRPDRIIVGEVRGAEVLDMLQAMNTGHAGSMSTAHANGPHDLLARLEAMALMAVSIPVDALRRQLASALDLVVHVEREPSGQRRVASICSVGDDLRVTEVPCDS